MDNTTDLKAAWTEFCKLWARGAEIKAKGDSLFTRGNKYCLEAENLRGKEIRFYTESLRLLNEGDKALRDGVRRIPGDLADHVMLNAEVDIAEARKASYHAMSDRLTAEGDKYYIERTRLLNEGEKLHHAGNVLRAIANEYFAKARLHFAKAVISVHNRNCRMEWLPRPNGKACKLGTGEVFDPI